jgi:predicted acylesterase/phospholipase RssA
MIVHLIQNNVMDTMVNFNIVNMINNSGAISYYPIQSTLEKMIISKIGYLPTLKDIKEKFKKKLVVVTYNLTLSRTEYISYEEYPDLPCITALRMSSNLPLVFEKFLYNKNFYVDGGISDNFAIKYGEKFGKKILGITLDDYQMQHKPDYNILEYMYNIISIPINEITKYSIDSILKKTKIIIVKLETKINMYEFKIDNTLKLNLFSTGYQQFKEQM